MEKSSLKRIHQTVFVVLIILLSLLPLYHMLSTVLGVGMNNLSNDYLPFSKFVIHAINNGISFTDLGRTCFRGQCEPLTFFVMIAIAKLFHWNTFVEIGFSVFVTAINVILIYILFAGPSLHPKKLWLIIFISALAFSFTQISSFTFGQASIYSSLCFLGLSLSLIGIRYFKDSLGGIIIVIAGTWISVWSYGAGLLVIPIIFIGLLTAFHKKSHYLLWFIALTLMSIPYLQYYLSGTTSNPGRVELVSLFRWDWMVKGIGLFFSNNFGFFYHSSPEFLPSRPIIFGYFGIVFFVIGLICYWGEKPWALVKLILPELSMILFSLACIWQISLVREIIGPWYVINAAPFWIGLVGLIYSFHKNRIILDSIQPFIKIGISFIFFFIIAILFINSNQSYEDKILHLRSRSPASAACLQYYPTAPTYCEGYVFQWQNGQLWELQDLAIPLEKNHLSVFAPHQIRTLQGEFVFDQKITIDSPSSDVQVSWWTGLNGEQSSWDDFKHLDINIPSPTSVSWTIEIPAGLENAEFHTAIGISNHAPSSSANEPITFLITIEDEDEPAGSVTVQQEVQPNTHKWQPIQIPLTNFAGKEITIRLNAQGDEGSIGKWAMFRFPYIELNLDESMMTAVPDPIGFTPENVEAPGEIDADPEKDLILDNRSSSIEGTNTYQFSDNPVFWRMEKNASLTLTSPITPCLANYTHFQVTLSMTPEVYPRYITVVLELSDQTHVSFVIPLLPDGNVHTYTYPLRLLTIPSSRRISNIVIILPDSQYSYSEIQFYGMRLKNNNSTMNYGTICEFPVSNIQPQSVVGEILDGEAIRQTFISDCDGTINQVGLFFGTYARTNTQAIFLTISDMETSRVLQEIEIPSSALIDNSWRDIPLDPIEVSFGDILMLEIRSPESVNGNAVTIYQSTIDDFPQGSLYVNGEEQVGDLLFKYYCKEVITYP